MPRLQLEGAGDVLNLDDIAQLGTGVQATTGATGLGLPDVSVQWLEGAGDGAMYRGTRVRPRDIDLPLFLSASDRAGLQRLLSRLAVMLAGECVLRLVEDDGTDWSAKVHRVGGGDYVYGTDTTGDTTLRTVITFRAGDPFFTYSRASRKRIANTGAGRGLLTGLSRMRVSSSQAIGTILLENLGDAHAYPVWDVAGPGRDFKAISVTGEGFHWTGALAAGQSLRVDTQRGTVIDHTGANRYRQLAPAPRLWRIPPGTTLATASMEDVTAASSITCSWRPRKWMVI
jgi:hypothetical protein